MTSLFISTGRGRKVACSMLFSTLLFLTVLFQFRPTTATNQIIFFTNVELSTLGPISAATAGNEIIFPQGSNDEVKQEDVRVRGLANGNLLVGWDDDTSNGPLYARVFDPAGVALTNDIDVYDGGVVGHSGDVTFAPTSDGGFYALWFKQDEIFARKFSGLGVAAGPSTVIISDTVNGFDAAEPEMVELPAGNFMLTWRTQKPDGDLGIAARLLDSSLDGLASIVAISESDTLDSSPPPKPAIAPLQNNGAIVVWSTDSSNFGSGEIYIQRLDSAGAKVGGNQKVNQDVTGAHTHPQIAPLANGNVVVVYDSNQIDGSGFGIAGRVFNGSAVAVTDEFVVNAVNTNNWQLRPDVVGLKDNTFVVSWESFGNEEGAGGSGTGVLAVQIDQTGTAVSEEFVINQSIAEKQDYAFIASINGNTPVVVWDGVETFDTDMDGIDTTNHTDAFMRILNREMLTTTQYSIGVTDTLTNEQVTLIGSEELLTVTVQISANYDQGFDSLNALAAGAINSNFDPSSGTLTLSGSNVTADYAAVIKTVSFQTNTTVNPAPPRTVTWSIFGVSGLLDTADIEIVINQAAATATPILPSPTSTPVDTATPTETETSMPSATPTSTSTITIPVTETPTVAITHTATPAVTETSVPTATPTSISTTPVTETPAATITQTTTPVAPTPPPPSPTSTATPTTGPAATVEPGINLVYLPLIVR